MKILVKTIGFIGDNIFATSVAKKLKEKNEEPKLGIKYYFPELGHVTLNPYITDEEVVQQISEVIFQS